MSETWLPILSIAVLAGALGMFLRERRRPRPDRAWLRIWLVFAAAAGAFVIVDLVRLAAG